MKPYYYIYNAGNNPPSVRHDTLKSAQEEAERLATKHAGKSFEILKCIGVSQTSNVSTFWMDFETGQDEVKYRNLEIGEIRQDGDEFSSYGEEGNWVKCVSYQWGDPISKHHHPHRRPL